MVDTFLADNLYSELREELTAIMKKKYEDKKMEVSQEFFDRVTSELASASMKFALLSSGTRRVINFNVQNAVDFEGVSGTYLMYNRARFQSLLAKYDKGVEQGTYPPLPPLDKVDFSLLKEDQEWELLLNYLLPFSHLVLTTACPNYPPAPQIPEFPTARLCEFLCKLAKDFSKYWSTSRVLSTDEDKHQLMFVRIYLLRALKTVLTNGLRLLTMNPLDKM